MISHSGTPGTILCLFALPLTAFSQPAPLDPLEPVTNQLRVAVTPASRQAALQLLARARQRYALASARQGYRLKVSFTVDSLGQTNYDGVWQMEDRFAPGQGYRWTALSASGYAITEISSSAGTFAEGTASAVPLRLIEARGALFDPIQSPSFAGRGSIRTSTATFNGAPVSCVLLSRSPSQANPPLGRGWDESEECVDPQSGLLRMHSEVPGHYAVYDYTNAPQLSGRVLPGSITITEAGRVVSRISVESLQAVASTDPALFVPTDAMKAAGRATAITSATKISRIHGQSQSASGVCVFGVVTSTGQLVEAHSLQPSDPNSQSALADAMAIDFSPTIPAGASPRQHFVFIIEKFLP